MSIFELADILNAEIRLTRYPNQENRWCSSFDHCDVKDGDNILIGMYGSGKVPHEAINDYVEKIKGRTIVFHAIDKNRRSQFTVPSTITA
jgi:hypothetical protein